MVAFDPCCGETVGVLVTNSDGRVLMFARQQPPPGVAPVAGHVGEHGDYETAARAEVLEEVGLTVDRLEEIHRGWYASWCRRGSDGHAWRIYRADASGVLRLAPSEADHAGWYDAAGVQGLAEYTASHAHGVFDAQVFAKNPGLEAVWCLIFADLGLVELGGEDRRVIAELACRPPRDGAR